MYAGKIHTRDVAQAVPGMAPKDVQENIIGLLTIITHVHLSLCNYAFSGG